MVNFPGRSDRRRRVLKEEVRTASGPRVTLQADVADDAPRYSDAAGVENHPQVTDFVAGAAERTDQDSDASDFVVPPTLRTVISELLPADA